MTMKPILFITALLLSLVFAAADLHAAAPAGEKPRNNAAVSGAPAASQSHPQALPADADHDAKNQEGGYLQFREYFNAPWRISGRTIPMMRKRILALSIVALVLFAGISLKKIRRNTIYES